MDLTARMIRSYDRLRAKRGISESLIIETASRAGPSESGTVSTGWYFEYARDRKTGEQKIQVLIAEHSGWNSSLMKNCAAVILNNRRHKLLVPPERPTAAPLVWLLDVAPTGESV